MRLTSLLKCRLWYIPGKLNGRPTLPVALVLLAMMGPEAGTGCTVIVSVLFVVTPG